MLYSGYFRNIDTSQDPKGQLYKVEVFTDGVLYTYNFLNIPQEQELLLSDSPFVVEYDSDNNKYKSYKGSTASIGIMMDNYGFISKGKCDIFVRLLKYKNDVVLNDNYYYNTTNQQYLYKKHIANRYMFVPKEVDDFCYEVEWVGYATPQVYSQDYTRIQEEYTLECQDVLTTLQYFEYNSTKKGITSFKDSITEALNTLPVQPINNIYITNTKRIPNNSALITTLKTINDNWIDESFERNNCLDVIDNLMSYLGLTIIQHKDNFYITTPDAIASGMKFYYKYDIRPLVLGGTGSFGRGDIVPIINFPNIGWYLLGKDIEISDGELATNQTKIGTTDTYKKAVITTDEFYDSNLITDIDNDDILEERFRWDEIVTYLKLDEVDRNILSHQYPYNYDMFPATSHYSGSVYDILANDVADTNNASLTQYYYQRDTESTTDSGYSVQHFTTVAAPVTLTDMFNKVGCSVVDFSAADINDNTTQGWMESYSGQRAWLFHNTYPQVGAGIDFGFGDVPIGVVPLMLDPTKIQNPSNAQTVLSFKSKKVFMRTNQSINITGNLEFFQTVQLPLAAGWSVEELKAYKPYMFVWCRLKIHSDRYNTNYYVTNTSTGYSWTTTNTWFKLWYDNYLTGRGGITSVTAFENMFSFNKNTRGAEGTCIELPSAFEGGEYQQIELDIKRPWGCGRETQHTDTQHFYPAQYTVMTNFKVNVIDTSETVYRYEAEENNQFKVDVNDLGVDDFETSLLVSSDYYKNTSKATVVGLPDDLCIEDRATGSCLFPEANYILNIEKSYATSKLRLDISLPYEVSPLDRVTWVTQINDKNFAIDQMSIDYAYNRYNLSLIECNLDEVNAEIFSEKRAKNFRRNGDNLYNPLPKRNKKRVQNPEENPEYDATFNVTSNRVQLSTESDTLLKHVFFEPTNVIELLATNPDYTDVTYEINNQGELIITYSI